MTKSAARSKHVVLALFFPAVLLGLGFIHHEPWRDEIQAWLMARDMDIPALLANAGTEGHPVGWHLLIKGFMALGLPYDSLHIFSLLCILAAAALLIRYGPFGLPVTALLLLSPVFILLGIAARPYSLIVLLFFAHACCFPRRLERPFIYCLILGGLPQLMVLCLPYVGVMASWLLWEAARERTKQPVIPALALLALLMLFAVWQLVPPVDKAAAMLRGRQDILVAWLNADINLFSLPALLLPVAFAAAWARSLQRHHPMLMLCAAASGLFAVLVNYFVYPLSDYHWHMLLALLAALTWIARANFPQDYREKDFRILMAPLVCACLLSCPGGAMRFHRELALPSSNLPEAERFVREHLARTPIAAHAMARVCPLLKALPEKRFWNPVSKQWGSFAVFDADWQKNRNMPMHEAAGIILEQCPAHRPAIIFSSPWPEAGQAGYVLAVDFSRKTAYEEKIYIYIPGEKLVPALP